MEWIIDDQIRVLLPEVVLQYLQAGPLLDQAVMEIHLTPVLLSTVYVQDILCVTPSGSFHHRVFGFPPVNAQLEVIHDECHTLVKMTGAPPCISGLSSPENEG